jgi:hypothetical protein
LKSHRTFQEGLLSRRVLMFTDYQMSFHCIGGSCIEGLGEYLTQMESKHHQRGHSIMSLPGKHVASSSLVTFKRFTDLAALYSQRELTFERDALNAFRGLMHDIRRLRPTAFSLCGLPFFMAPEQEKYEAWSDRLMHILNWYPLNGFAESKRRRMFPSWTWVGWYGGIRFPGGSNDIRWNYGCIIRDILLGCQAGSTLDPRISIHQQSHDDFQQTLDTVTSIHFNAPEIPVKRVSVHADMDSFTICGSPLEITYRKRGVFDQLMPRLEDGTWSCLLMNVGQSGGIIVMLVEWREDGVSAERVELYPLSWWEESKNDLGPLEELNWRRVRLI